MFRIISYDSHSFAPNPTKQFQRHQYIPGKGSIRREIASISNPRSQSPSNSERQDLKSHHSTSLTRRRDLGLVDVDRGEHNPRCGAGDDTACEKRGYVRCGGLDDCSYEADAAPDLDTSFPAKFAGEEADEKQADDYASVVAGSDCTGETCQFWMELDWRLNGRLKMFEVYGGLP